MREIKFRCWDTENKEMLDIQELDYRDSYNGQPMIRTTMYSDYYDTEDMILMQYTGLKDKNGKEIYEGDIIYCKKYIGGNWIEDCIEKGYVNFNNGEFGLYRKQEYYQSLYKFKEYDYEFEVIGNMYDNPELLAEKE